MACRKPRVSWPMPPTRSSHRPAKECSGQLLIDAEVTDGRGRTNFRPHTPLARHAAVPTSSCPSRRCSHRLSPELNRGYGDVHPGPWRVARLLLLVRSHRPLLESRATRSVRPPTCPGLGKVPHAARQCDSRGQCREYRAPARQDGRPVGWSRIAGRRYDQARRARGGRRKMARRWSMCGMPPSVQGPAARLPRAIPTCCPDCPVSSS